MFSYLPGFFAVLVIFLFYVWMDGGWLRLTNGKDSFGFSFKNIYLLMGREQLISSLRLHVFKELTVSTNTNSLN